MITILLLKPKVVSPVGAKQPAALHRWGVRTSNPHRGGFTPPVGKNPPRCASVELGCATRLLGDGTRPMWLRPGPVGDGTRPMKVTDRPRAKVPPVQARKPAFGGSRPGSTGLFLIESRGGGLSPAGQVFFNIFHFISHLHVCLIYI